MTKATDKREQLIEAAVVETVEVGLGSVSVNSIARRAGLSRTTFYSLFADKEEAVEAAYRCRFERYLDQLLQVCGAQPTWPLKVKVGIGVTLDMVAASPVDAQFVIGEAMAVSDEFRLQVLDSRDRLAGLLVAGRTEAPYGAELPDLVESALIGGISGVVSTQLRAGEAKHLPALAPELVELALTPYLGREEAAEVARRPRPGSGDR